MVTSPAVSDLHPRDQLVKRGLGAPLPLAALTAGACQPRTAVTSPGTAGIPDGTRVLAPLHRTFEGWLRDVPQDTAALLTLGHEAEALSLRRRMQHPGAPLRPDPAQET